MGRILTSAVYKYFLSSRKFNLGGGGGCFSRKKGLDDSANAYIQAQL